MATFIVGAVVLAVVGLIIRSMVKDKKNGKSLQCGCDCNIVMDIVTNRGGRYLWHTKIPIRIIRERRCRKI